MQILIVDDDELACRVMESHLRDWGYSAAYAVDSVKARKFIEQQRPELIISDVVMPELSGLELTTQLEELDAQPAVILVTGHASVDMAVEAMKAGARDFITKPIDFEALKATIEEILEDVHDEERSREIASRVSRDRSGFSNILGASKPMKIIFRLLKKVAPAEASVLITGESGTGKELVARAIHSQSRRSGGPFLPVNVAAIPSELMESELFGHEKGAFTGATAQKPGCFELSHQGTLLLDEIGEMPMALQPKLLRVLEDGKVRRLGAKKEFHADVRVLAATNRDPIQAVEDGSLRQDLFYRLNVFHIDLPPLRERGADLILLARHFLEEFNAKHDAAIKGLRESTERQMKQYLWPGNVRELRNVMERAVVLAEKGWIEASHLPPYMKNSAGRAMIRIPFGTTAAEAEKEVILRTYEHCGKNKSKTARSLGLDVKTVRTKLQSYGIDD